MNRSRVEEWSEGTPCVEGLREWTGTEGEGLDVDGGVVRCETISKQERDWGEMIHGRGGKGEGSDPREGEVGLELRLVGGVLGRIEGGGEGRGQLQRRMMRGSPLSTLRLKLGSKTHSGAEKLCHHLEPFDVDFVVEKRGGKLEEREGEGGRSGERRGIAEAKDFPFELGGELRKRP